MGAGASLLSAAVQRHLSDEFNRVKDPERNYMLLSEIQRLEPLDDIPINFRHLGTLFCLDASKTGRVTLQDLMNFASFCSQQQKKFKKHEFASALKGILTLKLFDFISKDQEAVDVFVEWILTIFSEGVEFRVDEGYPGVEFVNRDAVHLIHDILEVEAMYGMDSQGFFDLLQQVGEEREHMRLDDESLDDFVPAQVLRDFMRTFVEGFTGLLKELCESP